MTLLLSAKVKEMRLGPKYHFLDDSRTYVEVRTIRLEIDHDDSGSLLLRYDTIGNVADTWHPSVHEAREQAEREFVIDGEWTVSGDPRGH